MTVAPIASGAVHVAASSASGMDEESFHAFYDRTARLLRAYLRRVLNDVSQADDILQEAYLRILQARLPPDMTAEHRKNYLFRIATNLARDERSSRRIEPLTESPSGERLERNVAIRSDIGQLLGALKLRDRELLWLAYVQRFSHNEIAAIVGAKPQSIRPMLARARERFTELLTKGGFARGTTREKSG